MAKYELKIYDKDDEVIKTYATNGCRWNVFIEASKVEEENKGKSQLEQLLAVNNLLKNLFVGLTDEELGNAYTEDIMSTFTQVVSNAKNLKTPNVKNA